MVARSPINYSESMLATVSKLGQEGKSKVQIAGALGISTKKLNKWCKDHEDLDEAISLAYTLFEAYWENEGMKGIKGLNPKFSAPAWSKLMQTRCKGDWAVENTQKIDVNTSIKAMPDDELQKEIAILAAKQAINKAQNNGSSGAPTQLSI
jgi:hypothetical protein